MSTTSTTATVDFVASMHRNVADAIADRNREVTWAVEHDGVSTAQIAAACGVTTQTVRNWIAAHRGE